MDEDSKNQPQNKYIANVPQNPAEAQRQPIQILQPLTQPQVAVTRNKKGKYLVFITGIISVIIISLLAGVFLLSTKPHSQLVDKTYGFVLSDIDSWKPIPPQGNNYLSFITFDSSNHPLSHADISVFPYLFKNTDDFRNESKKGCDQLTKFNQSKNTFGDFKSGSATGFICKMEVVNPKDKIWEKITAYSLYGPSKRYAYTISTSYPSDNANEADNEKKLISGFRITK